MEDYTEQLKFLRETDMFYWGVRKVFRGKVDKSTFFSIPGLIINTFGYYRDDEGTWVAFVTDDERGVILKRWKELSEETAIKSLYELCNRHNFSHYEDIIIEHFEEKHPIIIEHLKTEYGYSDIKAQKALDYLLQAKFIAFEYWYYIENGHFILDEYAEAYSGYTAKRIATETDLTVLGAFNYMVYLKQKPDEALANLKNGLPRK